MCVSEVVEPDRRHIWRSPQQAFESLRQVIGVDRFAIFRGEDVPGVDDPRLTS